MARPKAQLRLGAFFNPTGHHVASWRHPGAQADAGINFKHYVEIAQTAERAKFDMVFLADKDRKSTRLNSSHIQKSRMPSSA